MTDLASLLAREAWRKTPAPPRVIPPPPDVAATVADGRIGLTARGGFIHAQPMPCARCDDGWVWRDGDPARCECRRMAAPARRISQARIPARLIGAAKPPAYGDGCRDAVSAARAMLASPMEARCLSIHGLMGRGKSHLAAFVAMRLAIAGAVVRWCTPATLLAEVKAGYDAKRSMDTTLAPYVAADLLVLDEVADEHDRAHMREAVQSLMRARHDAGHAGRLKLSVMTSNANPPDASGACEMAAIFGPRLWDRMMADFDFVRMVGRSWRRAL